MKLTDLDLESNNFHNFLFQEKLLHTSFWRIMI